MSRRLSGLVVVLALAFGGCADVYQFVPGRYEPGYVVREGDQIVFRTRCPEPFVGAKVAYDDEGPRVGKTTPTRWLWEGEVANADMDVSELFLFADKQDGVQITKVPEVVDTHRTLTIGYATRNPGRGASTTHSWRLPIMFTLDDLTDDQVAWESGMSTRSAFFGIGAYAFKCGHVGDD